MAGTLDGKVAIVTGGNSGIGEASVHRLAREGARVAILARRRPEGEAVERAVRAAGGEATFLACDVTQRPAIEAAVAATLERCGALHILFNNASGGGPQRFPEPDEEDFERVLRLNLTSTYMLTQACWRHLVAAGGGSIVNMSSLAAVAGVAPAWRTLVPGFPPPAYGAAKAGIEALTRWTASEGAAVKIRCNAVRPGQIVTPGTSARTPGHHGLERVFDQIQITRGPGYAADVANAVYFFASDESRFVTGQVLDIDGGALAKL